MKPKLETHWADEVSTNSGTEFNRNLFGDEVEARRQIPLYNCFYILDAVTHKNQYFVTAIMYCGCVRTYRDVNSREN